MANLNKRVTIRFSDEEYEKILTYVEQTNLPISQLCRELILNKKPIFSKQSNDSKFLLHEMKKQGNNINQLAHKFNLYHNQNKLTESIFIDGIKNLISYDEHLKNACAVALIPTSESKSKLKEI